MTSSGMSWLIIRPDVLGDILRRRKLVYFFTNAKGNSPQTSLQERSLFYLDANRQMG
jgi:hypothetical protein